MPASKGFFLIAPSGIVLTTGAFDPDGHWTEPIEENPAFFLDGATSLFDQNGYAMTPIEKRYYEVNGRAATQFHRSKEVLRSPWMEWDRVEGPHFNHCCLFERKTFSGEAREQLERWAGKNPMLWKLIRLRPKWGIDVSIDYVDREGNVFEVFHYEWDAFEFAPVQAKKEEIEGMVLATDWEAAAKELLARKDEWHSLGFMEQSAWRCDFFGVEEERFKLVAWE